MPADTVASEARALEPVTGTPSGTDAADAALQPVETDSAEAAPSDGPVSPAAAVNGRTATNT